MKLIRTSKLPPSVTNRMDQFGPPPPWVCSRNLIRVITRSPHMIILSFQTAVSKWIERIYATTQGNILIGMSNQGAKFLMSKRMFIKISLPIIQTGLRYL